jgi:hypothetical protein
LQCLDGSNVFYGQDDDAWGGRLRWTEDVYPNTGDWSSDVEGGGSVHMTSQTKFYPWTDWIKIYNYRDCVYYYPRDGVVASNYNGPLSDYGYDMNDKCTWVSTGFD